MSAFAAPIAEQIWNDKYRFTTDTCIEDTWRRVAKALASVEKNPEEWEDKFYSVLEDFKFLPAGRIISGAGTGRDVTLMNCFVSDSLPDSMDGIFTKLREAALTMQQGGGIGYDFSTIRPKGAPVVGVGSDASGPLSFAEVFDAMCRTVMSAGSRRGAQMLVLRCDHPDIFDFVKIKQDPTKLRNFNLSVAITDPFMQAVEDDEDWDLVFGGKVYRTIRARELWDTILESTYAYAEPGVIFMDRVNYYNNLWWCEDISATNPSMPAGTLVHTDRGIIPIEQLEGQSFKVRSMDGTWAEAKCFLSGEDEEVLEIDFGGGKTVRSTKQHRWPVLLADNYLKVDASVLAPGMYIPMPLNERLGLNNRDDLTYRDGLVAGITFGDGCYGVRKDDGRAYLSIHCNRADTDLQEIVANYFGKTVRPQSDECVINVTTDAEVRAFVEKVGLTLGDKTHLPHTVWNSNDEFIAGFIDGLFSSDGCIQPDFIHVCGKNKDAITEIGKLLAFHGINSSHVKSVGELNGKTFERYDLKISKGSVDAFLNLFKLSCLRKMEKVGFMNKMTRRNKKTNHQQIVSVKSVGRARVWDISVYHDQHVFPTEWVYTGNCGEQPLAPDSSCLLGSINLTQFVKDPFGESPVVDLNELLDAVGIAVRMLDNVNDVTNYPLDRQRKAAQNKRRIGLGVTGFADALLMMKHRYGSDQAVQFVHDIFERITERAYLESTQLAAEKGPFPEFDGKQYSEGAFISRLPLELRNAIARDGIRNSHLTSIAPTGTISLLAGNVSSGIEPIFATSYTRKVLQPDGSHREEEVVDYAVKLYREMFGDDAELPDYFVTTADLKPEDHVRMQAAAQKYVDSAISKTINCPEDISFDDFKDVYRLAYELGCKGCTTYRPNDVTGSVLSVKEDKKPAAPVEPVASDVLRDRPAALQGQTYKLRFPSTDAAFYVTINDDDEGNPFEMFVNTKDPSHQAWVVALTRMVSAVFRRGGDVRFVAEELQAVFDPTGGSWIGGKYVPSIPAAIGAVLREHLGRSAPVFQDLPAKEEVKTGAPVHVCPKCFGTEFKKESGCETCISCGHSKCG